MECMYYKMNRLAAILLLAAIFALPMFFGCNGNPVRPNQAPTYHISGVLVADPNIDTTRVIVGLTRDDSLLTNASLYLDGRQLLFADSVLLSDSSFDYWIDSVYYYDDDSVYIFTGDLTDIRLTDPNRYVDTLPVAVADSFSILTVDPFNHLLLGLGNVTLNWSGSGRAEAYVLAAVKSGNQYKGIGYSAYPQTDITGGTIPPEAFADPISNLPDTGLYNLYVYAITGAPDSAISEYVLPVPLPDQLADNVSGNDISGNFGTVTIVYYDTLRVAIMP